MIRHTYDAREILTTDGDIDAVVIKIRNTGDSTVKYDGAKWMGPGSDETTTIRENYIHTINHSLKREPVGCQVIWADEFVNVKVESQDTNNIKVVFDTARANVNLRIW